MLKLPEITCSNTAEQDLEFLREHHGLEDISDFDWGYGWYFCGGKQYECPDLRDINLVWPDHRTEALKLITDSLENPYYNVRK